MIEFEKGRFDSMFSPKNIAIIGVSRNFMKWGNMIFANIYSEKYYEKGKIYLINPKHEELLGHKVYPNISSIPEKIDLAYITLPSQKTPAILKECGEFGVNSVVIIAGGFGETGDEGKKLEKEISEIALKYNLYLLGPNTMGLSNPWFNLHGLMPKVTPQPGDISFVSQSGNIGTQLLQLGMTRGIGFSKFVCSGNEAIISVEDYIKYFGLYVLL